MHALLFDLFGLVLAISDRVDYSTAQYLRIGAVSCDHRVALLFELFDDCCYVSEQLVHAHITRQCDCRVVSTRY